MEIIERIYRGVCYFIMALASTSLLPAIYFIKSNCKVWNTPYPNLNLLLELLMYIGIPVLMSFLSLLWMRSQSRDSINADVREIAPVNHEYLPVYLGYIFVSLSMPNLNNGDVDWITLSVVYSLICLFVTCSKTLCFNPIFIVFGYGYYQVTTKNGVKVFVITNRKISKGEGNPSFPHLRKVNELVYIERKKVE